MANAAPRATRNSLDDPMPNWGVSLTYDTQNDVIEVRWWRADLLNNRGRRKVSTFGPENLEDALAAYQVAVRTLGARRLL